MREEFWQFQISKILEIKRQKLKLLFESLDKSFMSKEGTDF